MIKYIIVALVVFLLHIVATPYLALLSVATLYSLSVAIPLLALVYVLSVWVDKCYQPYYAARMTEFQRKGLTPEHIQYAVLMVCGFLALFLSEHVGQYLK